MMKNMKHTVTLLLFTLLGTSACGLPAQPPQASGPTSYFLASQKWESPFISVCWENSAAPFEEERQWVRSAVEGAYEGRSEFFIDFTGWQMCSELPGDVRIRVGDEQPFTNGIGAQLRRKPGAVTLNFTYRDWNTSCRFEGVKEGCISGAAIHEFGHVLGLLHEQDRGDRSAFCDRLTPSPAGQPHGNWDAYSIMNYCNPYANNDGFLSGGDIEGLSQLYGFGGDRSPLGPVQCPEGYKMIAVGNQGGRLCTDDTNAWGPFTKAMITRCLENGGGSDACSTLRWGLRFTLWLRGTDVCPAGATLDPLTRYCIEGQDAFGPFPKPLVDACVKAGGRAACQSARWSAGFLRQLIGIRDISKKQDGLTNIPSAQASEQSFWRVVALEGLPCRRTADSKASTVISFARNDVVRPHPDRTLSMKDGTAWLKTQTAQPDGKTFYDCFVRAAYELIHPLN